MSMKLTSKKMALQMLCMQVTMILVSLGSFPYHHFLQKHNDGVIHTFWYSGDMETIEYQLSQESDACGGRARTFPSASLAGIMAFLVVPVPVAVTAGLPGADGKIPRLPWEPTTCVGCSWSCSREA
jgi:hypothetical protein